LTLSAAGTGVLVGVVTDGDVPGAGPEAPAEISTVVVDAYRQIWVEARWTPSAS